MWSLTLKLKTIRSFETLIATNKSTIDILSTYCGSNSKSKMHDKYKGYTVAKNYILYIFMSPRLPSFFLFSTFY